MVQHGTGKDAFDTLVNLESSFHASGVAEGERAASESGYRTGYGSGFEQGARRGCERQYYRGAAHALLALHDAHPQLLSTRAVGAAREIMRVTTEMQLHKVGNSDNIDFDDDAEMLRHHFKLMCAIGRLPPLPFIRKDEVDDFSF